MTRTQRGPGADAGTRARDEGGEDPDEGSTPDEGRRWPKAMLVVGSLGVVFGDIGTSPLYALREVLGSGPGLQRESVLGLTSMMIWSLLLVVTALYIGLLMRCDNEGEGGLLALVALVRRASGRGNVAVVATFVGMVGAAMFLGDSIITPAISVLSAAEGLTTADKGFEPFIVPISLAILAGVFVLQRIGSGGIGKLYGPIMVCWFALLAVTGAVALSSDLGVAAALSPTYAVGFLIDDPVAGFVALGSVVLVVTGAEAVYADLGHFGRRAITFAWVGVVLPALTLGYLGEAATVIAEGKEAASDPFYAVVPEWATIPVLVLATLATIIASQAVIAGAYTVVHQLSGLGMFPHLRTRHTSRTHSGQIYVPAVNWTLAAAVLAVVLLFRSSEGLSSAYGLAVSATFVSTVSLFLLYDRACAGRFTWRQGVGALMLLLVLVFVAATARKFLSGGWFPVANGLVLLIVMGTFWEGRRRMRLARHTEESSAVELITELTQGDSPPHRIEGTAVFLTDHSDTAPMALRTLASSGLLHQRVVLLAWDVADTPRAQAEGTAVTVEQVGDDDIGVSQVDVLLGYRERLDVVHVLEEAKRCTPELLSDLDLDTATFFVSDAIPRLSKGGMAPWRQRIFLVIDRLSTDRVEQLHLPRARTITVGRDVLLSPDSD